MPDFSAFGLPDFSEFEWTVLWFLFLIFLYLGACHHQLSKIREQLRNDARNRRNREASP